MENPMASIEHRPKVAAAFVKAQRQFAPALKNSTNPHFKSQYVDLAGCVEAVMDALNHEGIALVQRSKHDPQGYGSALTYARRYSLMAACGIAPADDDGNAASAKVSKEQVANIEALAEEVGKPIADINSYFGVKKVADLPAAQYQGIIKTLEKKREEQK